jgi:hypothetical protein
MKITCIDKEIKKVFETDIIIFLGSKDHTLGRRNKYLNFYFPAVSPASGTLRNNEDKPKE